MSKQELPIENENKRLESEKKDISESNDDNIRRHQALAGMGVQPMVDGKAEDIEFQGKAPETAGTISESETPDRNDYLFLKYADNVLYWLDFTKELKTDEINNVIDKLVRGGSLPEKVKSGADHERLLKSLKIRQKANFSNESNEPMNIINKLETVAKMVLKNKFISESTDLSRGAVKYELSKLMKTHQINENINKEANFRRLMDTIEYNKKGFVNESGVAYLVPSSCYRNPWLTHKLETIDGIRGYKFANQYQHGVVTATVNGQPRAVYVNENNQIAFAHPIPTSVNKKSMIQSADDFRKYAKYVNESMENEEEKIDESEIEKIIDESEENYGEMVEKLMSGANKDSVVNESDEDEDEDDKVINEAVDKSKVTAMMLKNGFSKSDFTLKRVYDEDSLVMLKEVPNYTTAYKIATLNGIKFYATDKDGRVYTSNTSAFMDKDGIGGDQVKYFRELKINESEDEEEKEINESFTNDDVYEFAKKTNEKTFDKIYSTFSEDDIKSFKSLVKLGDEKNLALWSTVWDKYKHDKSKDKKYFEKYLNESGFSLYEFLNFSVKDKAKERQLTQKFGDVSKDNLIELGKELKVKMSEHKNSDKERWNNELTIFQTLEDFVKSKYKTSMDKFLNESEHKEGETVGDHIEHTINGANITSIVNESIDPKDIKVGSIINSTYINMVVTRIDKAKNKIFGYDKRWFDKSGKKVEVSMTPDFEDRGNKHNFTLINESMAEVSKHQKEMNSYLNSRKMDDAKFKKAYQSFIKMNEVRTALGMSYFTMPNLEARAKKMGWANESFTFTPLSFPLDEQVDYLVRSEVDRVNKHLSQLSKDVIIKGANVLKKKADNFLKKGSEKLYNENRKKFDNLSKHIMKTYGFKTIDQFINESADFKINGKSADESKYRPAKKDDFRKGKTVFLGSEGWEFKIREEYLDMTVDGINPKGDSKVIDPEREVKYAHVKK